ncbi:MAG: glycoside hydrolase [Muribaculaceae bacterium]|nr:glycoside hydrolase [Muribaculaceae bacterium]
MRSVDGGRSWEVITPAVDNDGDESKMAELADGSLLMSIRNRWKGWRKFARSFDGGKSWTAVEHSSSLPDPACNGDMLVLPDGRIVHSINDSHTHRCCVSLFVYDPVETVWRKTVEICPEPSSYSALCRLADGRVGVLSEELSPGHGLHIWFTSVDTGMFDL